MKLSPKDARIILKDKCLDSLIEACVDFYGADPNHFEHGYLIKVEKALRNLKKQLVILSKKKVTKKS